jgi:hypothetical protein
VLNPSFPLHTDHQIDDSAADASMKTDSGTAMDGCRFQITLAPQTKGFDDGTVALNIVAFNIIEQPSTLTHQHQKSPPGVVIFLVNLQMLGQVRDSMGQKTDLNLRRTGIAIVLLVFFDELFFGFCVVRHCSRPP